MPDQPRFGPPSIARYGQRVVFNHVLPSELTTRFDVHRNIRLDRKHCSNRPQHISDQRPIPGNPHACADLLVLNDHLGVLGAIAESPELDNGLVLRYRVDETDDGLSDEEEGTFAICSFWLVSALVEIGELDDARALLEKLLALASPLGLYAEELDPRTGRHLGNFPQAFTHLALINATMQVIRAERAQAAEADAQAPS